MHVDRYLEDHFESNIIAVAVPSQLDSAEAILRAVPAALPVVPKLLSAPPQPAPNQPEGPVMALAPTSPEDLAGPVGATGAEGQTKDVVATAPKQARHRSHGKLRMASEPGCATRTASLVVVLAG